MMLSKDDSLMCIDVLGNVYFKFCKFSCEPLFVLLMQYIQANTTLDKEIEFLFWLPQISRTTLVYANVNLAMTDPKPVDEDTKQFQEWNTSSRVCLMTLKWVIPEVYQGKLDNISTRWIEL